MIFGIEKILYWQMDHPLHMFLILLDTTIYKCFLSVARVWDTVRSLMLWIHF